MAIPVLHSDAQDLSRAVGGAILYQNFTPYLTDAEIAAATNAAGLKVAVLNKVLHSDQLGLIQESINRAIDIGAADTSLSDSNIQAATNAATLAANTYGSASKKGPLDLV